MPCKNCACKDCYYGKRFVWWPTETTFTRETLIRTREIINSSACYQYKTYEPEYMYSTETVKHDKLHIDTCVSCQGTGRDKKQQKIYPICIDCDKDDYIVNQFKSIFFGGVWSTIAVISAKIADASWKNSLLIGGITAIGTYWFNRMKKPKSLIDNKLLIQ